MENRLNPTGEGKSQKKEWYKKWWGVIIALMIWPLFSWWYIIKKAQWSDEKKGLAIIGVIILSVIMFKIGGSSNSVDVQKDEIKQAKQETGQQPAQVTEEQKAEAPQTQTQPETVKTIEIPTEPITKIENDIKQVSDKFEITIWDSKGNFAKSTTPPPYEVIVNAGNGAIANCDYAKITSFQIMKAVYSDSAIKDKVSRVLFTSWGNLRVSLGSEDGAKMDWSPAMAGPTNFWKVMMQVAPYENETGSLSQRTWGKFISSDCK